MYEKHRTGGSNDHKEIVVDTRSISVQTEDTDLIKCKEYQHSEKHPSATHRNRRGKREGCG